MHQYGLRVHPQLALTSPPLSSLLTAVIPAKLLCFCADVMHVKDPPCTHIFVLSVMFCVAPLLTHPIAPIYTHLYPSASICAIFCLSSQKHDVRGNFPGHRAKYMPYAIVFVSACLAFAPSCAPIPYSTHKNPSAPTYTYLYSFSPRISMYVCIIYNNLIKK